MKAAEIVRQRGAGVGRCGLSFSDGVSHKLLNSVHSKALLAFNAAGVPFSFLFGMSSWLQALDSTQGTCFFHANERRQQPSASLHWGKAEAGGLGGRFVATDDHGGVNLGEKAFRTKDPANNVGHENCWVHRGANTRRKTVSISSRIEDAEAFTVNVCLALGYGTAMEIFREELAAEITEDVVFRPEAPVPSNLRKVQALLDAFCQGSDPDTVLQREIISAMMTGNPECAAIEYFSGPNGACTSREDYVGKVPMLVLAFAHHIPKLYQRRCWTGQKESLDFILMLEGFNRLFSRSVIRFAQRLGHRIARKALQDAAVVHWIAPVPALEAGGEEEGEGEEAGGGQRRSAARRGQANAAPAGGGAVDGRAAGQPPQSHDEQSRSRRKVLDGVAGDGPFPSLFVLRSSIVPQEIWMSGMLKLSSSSNERREEARAARAAVVGEEGFLTRAYRGLEYARGTLVTAAIERTCATMRDAAAWDSMPVRGRTERVQADAFRTLACLLCLLSEIEEELSGYPYRLFLLLQDPRFAEVILREYCLHDRTTIAILRAIGARGLGSPEARYLVRLYAYMFRPDSVEVECLHATLRRILHILSVQTDTMSLEDCSAHELLRRLRKVPVEPGVAEVFEGEARREAAQNIPHREPKRRRGGGGAWRAFVALSAGTGKMDLRELAVLYWALTVPERRRMEAIGATATIQHREGRINVFGPTSKYRERDVKLQRVANIAQASLDDDGRFREGVYEGLAQQGVEQVANSRWTRVLAVKAMVRAAHAVERRKKELDDNLVKESRSSAKGARNVEDALRDFPSLSVFRDNLIPVELGGEGPSYHFVVKPVVAMRKAREIASMDRRLELGRLLHDRLEELWKRLHATVPTDKNFDFKVEKVKTTPCEKNKLCICKRGGNSHVRKLAENVMENIKHLKERAEDTEGEGGRRKELLGGYIVCTFLGRRASQVREHEAHSESDEIFHTTLAEDVSIVMMHIGWQWQKPWKSLLHLVERVEPLRPGTTLRNALRMDKTLIQSKLRAHGFLRGLLELDKNLRWDMVFSKIQEDAVPVEILTGHRVRVSTTTGNVIGPVWNPFRQRTGGASLMNYTLYYATSNSFSSWLLLEHLIMVIK